jgi:pectin methylesterase-like acyl-CoA thioesterase
MKLWTGTSSIALIIALAGCDGNGSGEVVSPPATSTPTPTPGSATAGLLPATGETAVHKDTLLKLTFNGAPVVTGSGTIRVYRSDGTLVDTIDTRADVVVAGGETQGAIGAANTEIDKIGNGVPSLTQYRYTYYRPIRISGNTATIKLHDGVLAYDTSYYVQIDQSVFNGPFAGSASFPGIGGTTGWTFRTKSAPTSTTSIVVDDDGPADFRSVQGALDYVMATGCLSCGAGPAAAAKTITIKNGIYDEQLFLRNVSNLTIAGESRTGTIVQSNNWDAFNPGTGGSRATPNTTFANIGGNSALGNRLSLGGGRAVFLIEGGDLIKLTNFTMTNTHVKDPTQNSQAEVIYYNSANLNGSRLIGTDMNFIGTQDTLQVKGWVWIYNSLIAGDVDFVWGYPYAALIENSELRTVADPTAPTSGGYIFQARSAKGYPGFVVLGGALTAASGVPAGSAYLARSGGNTQAAGFCTTTLALGGGSPGNANQYCDNVAYIGVRMGDHIAPAGWFINPVPNLLPSATEGWRESGSLTATGTALPLTGRNTVYASSRADLSALNPRAKVFAQWNGNLGWNPQP